LVAAREPRSVATNYSYTIEPYGVRAPNRVQQTSDQFPNKHKNNQKLRKEGRKAEQWKLQQNSTKFRKFESLPRLSSAWRAIIRFSLISSASACKRRRREVHEEGIKRQLIH
jgi:hypothetical protein